MVNLELESSRTPVGERFELQPVGKALGRLFGAIGTGAKSCRERASVNQSFLSQLREECVCGGISLFCLFI